MKTFDSIGVGIPEVYLPRPGVDMTRWAVVACDQYTSEPEYWEQVQKLVGQAPSTFRLTLPEVYLGKPGEAERIQSIQAAMRQYLDAGTLEAQTGMIYVERTTSVPGQADKTRCGLVLCLDLERYDYNKGSSSLIRATEGTIVERLPPRMKIRQGAPLEFPHILVLIDDPRRTVIEPVGAARARLPELYDFDLMMGGGHLRGYRLQDENLQAQVIQALESLSSQPVFQDKYGVGAGQPVLLFAMGDGNHSLATAKATWEKQKASLSPEAVRGHPARYALVEIENVHDQGLEFEPIHRVLFGMKADLFKALAEFYGENATYHSVENESSMLQMVKTPGAGEQVIGLTHAGGCGVIRIRKVASNLAVGTLQPFLDNIVKSGQAESIDYVHGAEVVKRLSTQAGNFGFFLPTMDKSDLFKTVILDGALPRKTFSMGEAHEKRFYVEGRKIA